MVKYKGYTGKVELEDEAGILHGEVINIRDVITVFLLLGRWGKHPVFERAWTVLSLLVMCLLAAVSTFDMFAG